MSATFGFSAGMLNGTEAKEEGDSTASKCRERRKRRSEMRRGMNSTTTCTSSILPESTSNIIAKPATNAPSLSSVDVSSSVTQPTLTAAVEAVPICGSMSVAGRMRQMEDAITIKTNLCRREDNKPLHFFGVYDGHGGPQVASYCREKMHVFMTEELMGGQEEESAEDWWQLAMKRCFKRMDEVALSTCSCGNIGHDCGRHSTEEVGLVGSTAIVAVVTAYHLVVANCGDSRAVLSRAGRVVPLSTDQKPDREDERARIESLGGRVIFLNGARVEGVLAMSRAIGDKYLKSFVTSEPEISFTRRNPEDECLILASDGLWDVVSSELACDIARECLQERNQPGSFGSGDTAGSAAPRVTDQGGAAGASYPSRSASAAALLTRLALGRQSADNISVIVVDLKC